MVVTGIIYSIIKKSYKASKVSLVFFLLKMFAVIFLFMYLSKRGPERLFQEDMLPLIWDKIMAPVATIVPIGSVFLTFFIGFGLMEFLGVFMEPIMNPLFKTPGRSAIDAVASLVGSCSLGIIITNNAYIQDKYTGKEAAIVATGFLTVSATFLLIVAKILNIVEYWNFYFFTTVLINLLVTAITARIYPLKNKTQKYYSGKDKYKNEKVKISFSYAFNEGMKIFKAAPSLITLLKSNFKEGFKMALSFTPMLLSVGMLGLIITEYTPIFDVLAYIFYPFTFITKTPEAFITAKALSLSVAEMLLPSSLVIQAPLTVRMLVGIVSVTEILFLSASIPFIMESKIPISLGECLIIWFQRVAISILITMPILHFVF